jgi:hypothetical protein
MSNTITQDNARQLAEPRIIPPRISHPEERERVLKEIVEEMVRNPIPADAPHLTREDFHARR